MTKITENWKFHHFLVVVLSVRSCPNFLHFRKIRIFFSLSRAKSKVELCNLLDCRVSGRSSNRIFFRLLCVLVEIYEIGSGIRTQRRSYVGRDGTKVIIVYNSGGWGKGECKCTLFTTIAQQQWAEAYNTLFLRQECIHFYSGIQSEFQTEWKQEKQTTASAVATDYSGGATKKRKLFPHIFPLSVFNVLKFAWSFFTSRLARMGERNEN